MPLTRCGPWANLRYLVVVEVPAVMSAAQDSGRLKALKSAPMDTWIALSSDESTIVASGGTFEEVSKKTEEAGLTDSVVIKTPKRWISSSV
jgi:hypothetical protein